MRRGKIQLNKNKAGQWYFKIIASNGRILCHSEAYTRFRGCMIAINAVLAIMGEYQKHGEVNILP